MVFCLVQSLTTRDFHFTVHFLPYLSSFHLKIHFHLVANRFTDWDYALFVVSLIGESPINFVIICIVTEKENLGHSFLARYPLITGMVHNNNEGHLIAFFLTFSNHISRSSTLISRSNMADVVCGPVIQKMALKKKETSIIIICIVGGWPGFSF